MDYIKCYKPVDVDSLFRHLLEQTKVTGLRGVHLVDEACPPASLLRLALLNRLIDELSAAGYNPLIEGLGR